MHNRHFSKLLWSYLAISLICVYPCYAEDVQFIFPDKIKVEEVRPLTKHGKFIDLEVGRFNSIEAINLSTETKYRFNSDNYTRATISLFGSPKGQISKDCSIGVILWPNEPEIIDVWRRERVIILSKQLNTSLRKTANYFEGQMDFDLAFPEYIFSFFNTCSSNVELNVYYTLKQL